MCMTSNRTMKGSGYASPSNLPYTEEESPVPVCQLTSATFGDSFCTTSSSSSACGWQPTNSIPKVVSSCSSSSPNTSPPSTCVKPSTKRSLQEMLHATTTQRITTTRRLGRPKTLQDLPLPLRKRTCHTPKERFAAFVAILLLQLDAKNKQQRNYKLSIQAKALVAECCRRNQMGDIHFMPLQQSLSERLHGLVGDVHWDRARTFLHIYLMRHHGFQPGRDEEEEDLELLYRNHNHNNSPPSQIQRCNSPINYSSHTTTTTSTSFSFSDSDNDAAAAAAAGLIHLQAV